MRYWDSSAIVPLLVDESTSRARRNLHAEDSAMATWWATTLECESALSRLERQSRFSPRRLQEARDRLRRLSESWNRVMPSELILVRATRLLRTHSLRAADALQLAAGLEAAERHTYRLEFACNDNNLSAAAVREGLTVV